MQSYLPACKIVSTHGVRGEMKALPLCDGAEFLAKFKRLYATADGTGECRVLGVRTQGNVILLRLADVTDMDAARAQVGRTYYFAKATPVCPRAVILSMTCWAVRSGMPHPLASCRGGPPAAQDIYTVAMLRREALLPPYQSLSRCRHRARTILRPIAACSTSCQR
ncbi:MAG: ribosome maturation factor RimM [Gemmiger sp.]